MGAREVLRQRLDLARPTRFGARPPTSAIAAAMSRWTISVGSASNAARVAARAALEPEALGGDRGLARQRVLDLAGATRQPRQRDGVEPLRGKPAGEPAHARARVTRIFVRGVAGVGETVRSRNRRRDRAWRRRAAAAAARRHRDRRSPPSPAGRQLPSRAAGGTARSPPDRRDDGRRRSRRRRSPAHAPRAAHNAPRVRAPECGFWVFRLARRARYGGRRGARTARRPRRASAALSLRRP